MVVDWLPGVTDGDYLVLEALTPLVTPKKAGEVKELLDALKEGVRVVPGELTVALAGYARLRVPGALFCLEAPKEGETTLTVDETALKEGRYFLESARARDWARPTPKGIGTLCTEVTRDYLEGKRPRPSPDYLRAVALTRGLRVSQEEAERALDDLLKRAVNVTE